MSVFVVVNPLAGGGRARRAWPHVAARLRERLGAFDHRETEWTGHATALVRDAVLGGADRVIAVGGDGTVNEAVNGLAAAGADAMRRVALGMVTVGTGSDLTRSLMRRSGMDAMIDEACGGGVREIDLGRVSFLDDSGQETSRLFANIASFGISGAIDRKLNARRPPFVPTKALFLAATVGAFVAHRPQAVRIRLDDGPAVDSEIAVVAVAIGRYFGGGIMIAPDAELDDGMFDVVTLRATSKLILLRDLQMVYGGRHRQHPSITIERARRVSVEAIGEEAGPVLLDIDGESPGRLGATFDIAPRALRLCC
ncbi:MAG: diacylglycerol kinase family lipid kinase [Mesorhizobium sp.]|nr:diacylglycerol kinase family lipid kinase [Mesorhizobium sp.]